MELVIRVLGSESALHNVGVKIRFVNKNCEPLEDPNNNPILYTSQYEVKLFDGIIELLT